MDQKTYIVGHRGFPPVAPQNTLSSFRAAIAAGADGVETDVQLTKDGEMVIHHDYSIDTTSNGHGRIDTMTFEEVRGYDFGIRRGEQFKGEKIPTFTEFLDTVQGMQVINVELKAPTDRSIPFVSRVVDEVVRRNLLDRALISAFDHSLLAQVKELCPQLRVGCLTFEPGMAQSPDMQLLAKAIPMDKKLADITEEDVIVPEGLSIEALLGPENAGTGKHDPRQRILELVHAQGAIFVGCSAGELISTVEAQRDLAAYAESLPFKPDFMHMNYKHLLEIPETVANLREMGIGSSPWTVDEPEVMRICLDLGCWSIITNRTDLLLEMMG